MRIQSSLDRLSGTLLYAGILLDLGLVRMRRKVSMTKFSFFFFLNSVWKGLDN